MSNRMARDGLGLPLPEDTNGRTWADQPWWQGKPEHEAPIAPVDMDEAMALTWARCWAYIDARDLPPEVCHVIWPIAYAALDACARITPTEEEAA